MTEILSQEWAIRALVSSCTVGAMCGLLGCFIVLRNMALIGDALSHSILPGVVVAFVFFGHNSTAFFMGAVVAGLLSSFFIAWIQERNVTKNDAAIGIVFTCMFSIGVIGISKISKSQGVHLDLKDFLFGNVLGVSNEDLMLTTITSVLILASIIFFYRYFFITTFQPILAKTMGISIKATHYFMMLMLSFAIVAALQTVGVILVVSMLIAPAATALLYSNRLPVVLIISVLIGILSSILGLIGAIYFETVPGPFISIVLTLFYAISLLASPKKGLIVNYLIRKRANARILLEDILKYIFRQKESAAITLTSLSNHFGISERNIKSVLKPLLSSGMIVYQEDAIQITELGNQKASNLVRAHRLWETYLTTNLGLEQDQIHRDAEELEHLLTEELLDEVDKILGYPTIDPHGSPIPQKD